MEELFETYSLYCTNRKCGMSIYKTPGKFSLPLTEASLSSAHFCSYCLKPLVSTIDVEIEQMISSVGVKPSGEPCYNTHF